MILQKCKQTCRIKVGRDGLWINEEIILSIRCEDNVVAEASEDGGRSTKIDFR